MVPAPAPRPAWASRLSTVRAGTYASGAVITTIEQDVTAGLDPEQAAPRLLAHLRTRSEGLDEREAARRLLQFGPNEVRRESGPRWWRSLLAQFTHPLALLLLRAGWSPGDPTGAGAPLHHAYLAATTMSFAGITACQVGTAFASRTSHASLRAIGVFTNPLLLGGIAFELAFAAALIYVPPLQGVFHTTALGLPELALLAAFPVLVWGSDELRRAWGRRHHPEPGDTHDPAVV